MNPGGRIILAEEKSKLGMNSGGRDNPCGRKKQAGDESGQKKFIPAAQKSKIKMQ